MEEKSGGRDRLGELAVKCGLVRPEVVAGMLSIQEEVRRLGISVRIGWLLVGSYHLGRHLVRVLLRTQARQRGEGVEGMDLMDIDLCLSRTEERSIARDIVSQGVLDPATIERYEAAAGVLARHGIRRHWTEILLAVEQSSAIWFGAA